MNTHRKLLVIVAVLALLTAGCGSGADNTADTSSTLPDTTTTTEQPTTTTVAATSTTEGTPDEEEDHAEEDHGEDSMETTDEVDRTVEVTMTDFEFTPSSYEVTAGETVRFVVSNNGAVEHEFRLSNEHRIEEHLASGHEDHGEEDGHHDEDGDVILLVPAGETGEMVVTFPDDTSIYSEVVCLLPGHYEAGMKAPIQYGDA